MFPKQAKICFKLGSIPVCMESNDSGLLEYAKSHFSPLIEDDIEIPLLQVTYLREEKTGSEDYHLSGYDIAGRGIYTDGKEVIWHGVPFFRGLRMRLSYSEDILLVHAGYNRPKTMKSRIKSLVSSVSGYGWSKTQFYFELMYHLVYYPVFWLLRRRGVYILHGGAIKLDKTGIVIVGAQGTGKSTIIANMFPRQDMNFLSDNILLYDNERVYSCYEPLRIDEALLASVKGLAEYLDEIHLHVPLGRKAYSVRKDAVIDSIVPEIFILPKMSGKESSLRPISEESLLSKALCFNILADEVRSFDIFSCVMHQLGVSDPCIHDEIPVLEKLLIGKKCFELNIKYGGPIEETVNKFLEVLSGTG